MISNRGAQGGFSRVWVWDLDSDRLSLVSERYVAIDNDEWANETEGKIHWFSDTQLLFPAATGQGRPTDPRTKRQWIERVTAQWSASLQGAEPSAEIFDSGVPKERSALTGGNTLLSCRLDSKQCVDVGDFYIYQHVYDFVGPSILPSADGRQVAYLSIAGAPLRSVDSPGLGRATSNTYDLQLVDRNGRRDFPSLANMKNVLPGSLRWSSDGRKLAFAGSFDSQLNLAGAQCADLSRYGVFILDTSSGALVSVQTPQLRPMSEQGLGSHGWGLPCKIKLQWANASQLLFAAEKVTLPSAERARTSEPGWWLIDATESPRNFTSKLGFVPEQLQSVLDGHSFAFARGSQLWLLSSSGALKSLTAAADGEALSIVWQDRRAARRGTDRQDGL